MQIFCHWFEDGIRHRSRCFTAITGEQDLIFAQSLKILHLFYFYVSMYPCGFNVANQLQEPKGLPRSTTVKVVTAKREAMLLQGKGNS